MDVLEMETLLRVRKIVLVGEVPQESLVRSIIELRNAVPIVVSSNPLAFASSVPSSFIRRLSEKEQQRQRLWQTVTTVEESLIVSREVPMMLRKHMPEVLAAVVHRYLEGHAIVVVDQREKSIFRRTRSGHLLEDLHVGVPFG